MHIVKGRVSVRGNNANNRENKKLMHHLDHAYQKSIMHL